MRKLLFQAFLFFNICTLFSQENGNFYGGLESNSQWLQTDEGINFLAPEDQFRVNNYVLLNYNLGNFTAGMQFESYLPSALLGYAPIYDGQNGVATYYINYKDEKIDVTGGFFYEQFGSGLILRSWEDRQLGLNNAMKGVNIRYKATEDLYFKAVFGKQRNGFEESEGNIQGIDADLNLSNALNINSVDIQMGLSYVGRNQDTGGNQAIPSNVGAYSGRFDFVIGDFYAGVEAIVKDPDAIVNEGQLSSNKLYDGTALQVNAGYARKGLGINATFRRLENFSFFADRLAEGNIFNQQVINYVPGLTKQQDYLLTNIYVYNPQPRLVIESFDQRAGEVGSQIDLYYSLKKGTALGGKYGTKIAANFSYWAGLDAEYNIENRWYKAKFIGSGQTLFRDVNLEVKKRLSKKWSSVFTYQNVTIDKGIVEGGPLGNSSINANIGVIEATRRFEKGKALRMVAQHLWSQDDRKNWIAGVLEYNFSTSFAIYAADNYNYEGLGKIHYYSVGGSYSKGNTRLGLNYGRQRGGLICIGGVCRFVPENTGLSANLTVAF
ncbi:DUF6029 family protein [Winogradskyella sp. UBA3174]|uniref:DUF6029 family protein n=1 Tax=Winogradskyella sp. UBA3174 TaxID=1947785 RepID=UPI0025D8B46E|nr:DUF6029 family protein [Winogradskyella sp. UBA3174]|tara:strand:- start:19937 stop:21586 length:1650 start_codon:yes stop_codon:yes gene_type:complete